MLLIEMTAQRLDQANMDDQPEHQPLIIAGSLQVCYGCFARVPGRLQQGRWLPDAIKF